jgi:ParB-like nuclease family protein
VVFLGSAVTEASVMTQFDHVERTYTMPLNMALSLRSYVQPEGVSHLRQGLSGPERMAQLRASMRASGQLDPIEIGLIGGKLRIADGHHRVNVAAELGLSHVQARMKVKHAKELGLERVL